MAEALAREGTYRGERRSRSRRRSYGGRPSLLAVGGGWEEEGEEEEDLDTCGEGPVIPTSVLSVSLNLCHWGARQAARPPPSPRLLVRVVVALKLCSHHDALRAS